MNDLLCPPEKSCEHVFREGGILRSLQKSLLHVPFKDYSKIKSFDELGWSLCLTQVLKRDDDHGLQAKPISQKLQGFSKFMRSDLNPIS